MMRSTQLVLPAVLLALALSACGGGGDPAPTASPVPSGTATPEPSSSPEPPDPSAIAASILVATDYVLVTAVDGSQLATFTMYEPAATAIASLTAALGTEPVVSSRDGSLETPPATVYDWSGLSVVDGEGGTIMNTDFVIEVATPSVGDVQVSSYFDLQVGDPMADALAHTSGDPGFAEYTYIGSIPIDPVSVGEPADWDLAIEVLVQAGPGGTIARFIAPAPNWGV
jgi:hypothetical protein